MSEIATPLPTPRRAGTSPILILAGIVMIEILIFVTGVAMGASGWDVGVLMLALMTIFVGTVPIVFEQSRPPEDRQLLLSLTAVVYMIFLVVPIFTQYFLLKGEYLLGTFRLTKYDPADIAHGQLVAMAGLMMLILGFYAPFGRLAMSAFPKPSREWSPNAALIISVITLGLGWLLYLAGQFGMVPQRAGSGALGTVAAGSFFGISLLTLTWLRHRRPEALLLLALAVPLSMAFNFFTGSKRLFLTPPFMVALAYIVYERRVRRNWVVAGFLVLIVLYPVSQFYRDAVQTDKVRSAASFLADPGAALRNLSSFMGNADWSEYLSAGLSATGARLDALGVLTVIVRDTPERVPYQDGRTIGLIFISYIPRVIWPEKPGTTIGEWVSQSYGSPYDLNTDVGPSWIGELFFNWGYAGVIFGMFVLGIFCRILQEMLFFWKAPIPALFGACVVLYAVTRTPQGGLIGPVNGTVYNLPPILIAHFLIGMFGGLRRTEPTPTP